MGGDRLEFVRERSAVELHRSAAMRVMLAVVLASCGGRVAPDVVPAEPPASVAPAAEWRIAWSVATPCLFLSAPSVAADGGIVVAGGRCHDVSSVAIGSIALDCERDSAVIRFDREGQALWRHCLDGYGSPRLAVAPSGETFALWNPLAGGARYETIVVERLSASGTPLFRTTLGEDRADAHSSPVLVVNALRTDGEDLLVGGYFSGHERVGPVAASSERGVWLARLDARGAVRRARMFVDVGGVRAMDIDERGQTIIVGAFEGGRDFDGRPRAGRGGFIAAFDRDLDLQWSRVEPEALQSVTATNEGAVVAGVRAMTQLDRRGGVVWSVPEGAGGLATSVHPWGLAAIGTREIDGPPRHLLELSFDGTIVDATPLSQLFAADRLVGVQAASAGDAVAITAESPRTRAMRSMSTASTSTCRTTGSSVRCSRS